jgi:preprotein translocase subunit SecA
MNFEHAQGSAMADEETQEQPEADPADNAEPYVRQAPKVGRNDPCPCGSGKKYKQCHGKIS